MHYAQDCPETHTLGHLRAVLWSIRTTLESARERPTRSLAYEVRTLPDAGIALADAMLDERSIVID